MSSIAAVAIWLLAFILPPTASPPAELPTNITLISSWGGLGHGRSYSATLIRQGNEYNGDGLSIRASDVGDLMRLLGAPLGADHLSADDVGSDVLRLRDNALRARYGVASALSDVRRRFLDMYDDRSVLAAYVATLQPYTNDPLKATCCDDYPHELLTLTFANGSTETLESRVRTAYMLPWRFTTSNSATNVANAEVSRWIAHVFAHDANVGRLSGESFADDYASFVAEKAAARYGPVDYLRVLPDAERAFALGDVRVSGSEQWGDGFVAATLTSDKWPQTTSVSFQCKEDASDLGAACARSALDSAKAALANPWIRRFADRHVSIDIRPPLMDFEDSIGDVELAKRAKLIAFANLLAKQSATKVAIGASPGFIPTSDWMLLPDGRLVLIGYNSGALALLGLNESKVGGTGYYRVVGAELLASGAFRRI